jgi:hypothetical protein
MKKITSFKLIIILALLAFFLTGCVNQSPKERIGGVEGFWADGDSAYRLTEDGLFQNGSFDLSTGVFSPEIEYVYIIRDGKIFFYDIPEDKLSRNDWISNGGYLGVKGDQVEAMEGYALYKGDYTVDESKIGKKIDLILAKEALEDSLAGNNQVNKDAKETSLSTASNKVETFEGIWVESGNGTDENGMHTASAAILFQKGRMYMGLKGQTADEIYNDTAGVRGNDKSGAPFMLQEGKLVITAPDGTKDEWVRDGTTFWAGDTEFIPEDGVILEVDPATLDWTVTSQNSSVTTAPAADLQALQELLQGTWVVNSSTTTWEFKTDGTFIETMSSSALDDSSVTIGTYMMQEDGQVYIEYGDYAISYTVEEVASGQLKLTDEYNREVILTK